VFWVWRIAFLLIVNLFCNNIMAQCPFCKKELKEHTIRISLISLIFVVTLGTMYLGLKGILP
jgi:hypothetical protein